MAQGNKIAALSGSLRDYAVMQGPSFFERADRFYAWMNTRRQHHMWPYSKMTDQAPATLTSAALEDGTRMQGANFASQDYLSLSSHPRIKEVAKAVVDEYGVHSAGSSALMGNTKFSRALEERIAAFTGYQHALVFPTGWAAGFGVVRGLVRPHDHVVIDLLAHACLREGVHTATSNVHNFRHLDNDGVREILKKIRARDTENAILVVTESLFSMDSDTPDIKGLKQLCGEYGATLVVDCAHDLGALGTTGRGLMEDQGVVGEADLLMGSFSKTFASNGGFVASNSAAIHQQLKTFAGPQTFSNAMSPVQAAIVKEAFDIVDSDEGRARRDALMRNILALREALTAVGLTHIGVPSPIVPVVFDDTRKLRLLSHAVLSHPVIVNFAEFPAVPANRPRVRLQVQTDHTEFQVKQVVAALKAAATEATAALEALMRHSAVPESTGDISRLRVG